ncbi:hypothetical protein EOL96_07625, partial [Candidatus Saccharibacteria bacterium]|nr:hypothetical protein [Candidatus Saccharibacteria bacterium]
MTKTRYNNTQTHLRRFSLYTSVLILLLSNLFSVFSPLATVQAIDLGINEPYERVFLENNIGTYGNYAPPLCVTAGDLTAPAPTSLTGETNAEKVWNYFIQRGLTPVAAAGAMG